MSFRFCLSVCPGSVAVRLIPPVGLEKQEEREGKGDREDSNERGRGADSEAPGHNSTLGSERERQTKRRQHKQEEEKR